VILNEFKRAKHVKLTSASVGSVYKKRFPHMLNQRNP
jgi:hypothetical protein